MLDIIKEVLSTILDLATLVLIILQIKDLLDK